MEINEIFGDTFERPYGESDFLAELSATFRVVSSGSPQYPNNFTLRCEITPLGDINHLFNFLGAQEKMVVHMNIWIEDILLKDYNIIVRYIYPGESKFSSVNNKPHSTAIFYTAEVLCKMRATS